MPAYYVLHSLRITPLFYEKTKKKRSGWKEDWEGGGKGRVEEEGICMLKNPSPHFPLCFGVIVKSERREGGREGRTINGNE